MSGILADIATEVQARASMASAGIQAEIALRISDAIARAPRHQLAGIIAALQAELQQALMAIAENAAAEIRARQQAAMMAHAGREQPADVPTLDDDGPSRPMRGSVAVLRVVAR